MDKDRNQDKDKNEDQQIKDRQRSAFNEPRNRDEKSTVNLEEQAELEQQRKEALTERD